MKEISEIFDELGRSRCWLQAVLFRRDDRWLLRHARVLIGEQPDHGDDRVWEYTNAVFLSSGGRLADLLGALNSAESTAARIGGFDVDLPRVHAQANTAHRPSFDVNDRVRLPRPVWEYQLVPIDHGELTGQQGVHGDYLVSRDAPSFVDVDSAFRAFFEDRWSAPTAGATPNDVVSIRELDGRAWIGNVKLTSTSLTVDVGGYEVDAAEMELFSSTVRASIRPEGPGPVTFALTDALDPANTWLWLKGEKDWFDHRSLGRPWADPDQLRDAGVDIDTFAADDTAQIETLIYAGEGPRVEFKSVLPTSGSTGDNPWKTIAAFANGDGGTIVFGVNRDEVGICGVGESFDFLRARDTLQQQIRSHVIPMPAVSVGYAVVRGQTVVVAETARGDMPPYGVVTSRSTADRPSFFVRRGASTFYAQPADLAHLGLRANPPRMGPSYISGFGG